MPQRKVLMIVTVITDDDNGKYVFGETDGGVYSENLKQYLTDFGKEGYQNLLKNLSSIDLQIQDIWDNLDKIKE